MRLPSAFDHADPRERDPLLTTHPREIGGGAETQRVLATLQEARLEQPGHVGCSDGPVRDTTGRGRHLDPGPQAARTLLTLEERLEVPDDEAQRPRRINLLLRGTACAAGAEQNKRAAANPDARRRI
mgnify:CR=1 FL=1